MRFCFFGVNRLAFAGGAEKYIVEVGKALKDKGHEVFYLGDCRSLGFLNILAGCLLNPFRIKQIFKALFDYRTACSFPPEAEGWIIFKKLRVFAFLPFSSAGKKVRKFFDNVDLVLVKNEILDMLIFFLFGCGTVNRRKALIIFTSLFYPSGNWRSRIHNSLYKSILYRFLVSGYDWVIVSNKADISYVNQKLKVPENKIKYIPYGLEPTEFPFRKIARKDNLFRILFVGRLEEQKGVDILVRIIEKLSNEKIFKKLKFTVIGDGPWSEQVVSLAKRFSNIKWLGLLPREKVKQAYLTHDLLLVPSRWETFSYVTLEAQFCGLPVVAFDIPGPQDIIEDHKTGSLVPLSNVDRFICSVNHYVKHRLNFKKRQNISQKAVKKFAMKNVAEKIVHLAL